MPLSEELTIEQRLEILKLIITLFPGATIEYLKETYRELVKLVQEPFPPEETSS